MGRNQRKCIIERFLAGMLSVLMIITMVPQTAFVSFAANEIEVHVQKRNEGDAENAKVTIMHKTAGWKRKALCV